jgi:adenylate kinase
MQVNDHLEEMMAAGGVVVDHHSSDFFPERFFDLVVVLQTDNTLHYDRLKARGYSEKKIQENVQCEIMHVPCEEAQWSYRPEVVQILSSDATDEMESNVERIVEWSRQFCTANKPVS